MPCKVIAIQLKCVQSLRKVKLLMICSWQLSFSHATTLIRYSTIYRVSAQLFGQRLWPRCSSFGPGIMQMNAVCLTWPAACKFQAGQGGRDEPNAFCVSRFEFRISNSHFANLFVQMSIEEARKLQWSLFHCDIPDMFKLVFVAYFAGVAMEISIF